MSRQIDALQASPAAPRQTLSRAGLILVEAPAHGFANGIAPGIAHGIRGIGDDPIAWAALGYIGFTAGLLGTWCVMEATRLLPTVVSSVGFLATPAVGIVLSNLLLGERFTPDLLAGSALILGGVAFAAWPGRAAATRLDRSP
jgi:drug/metabolite transporter (DMT)-like permease